jgi:hypothetical protein
MTDRTSRPDAIETLHRALEASRHIKNVELPLNGRGYCHWLTVDQLWLDDFASQAFCPACCAGLRLNHFAVMSASKCTCPSRHIRWWLVGCPRTVRHTVEVFNYSLPGPAHGLFLPYPGRTRASFTASTSVSPAIHLKQLNHLSSSSPWSSKTCRFRLCAM